MSLKLPDHKPKSGGPVQSFFAGPSSTAAGGVIALDQEDDDDVPTATTYTGTPALNQPQPSMGKAGSVPSGKYSKDAVDRAITAAIANGTGVSGLVSGGFGTGTWMGAGTKGVALKRGIDDYAITLSDDDDDFVAGGGGGVSGTASIVAKKRRIKIDDIGVVDALAELSRDQQVRERSGGVGRDMRWIEMLPYHREK